MCTADGADRLVCGKKRNGASTGVPGFRLRHLARNKFEISSVEIGSDGAHV